MNKAVIALVLYYTSLVCVVDNHNPKQQKKIQLRIWNVVKEGEKRDWAKKFLDIVHPWGFLIVCVSLKLKKPSKVF